MGEEDWIGGKPRRGAELIQNLKILRRGLGTFHFLIKALSSDEIHP